MRIPQFLNVFARRPASSSARSGETPPKPAPAITVTKPPPPAWKRLIDQHLNTGQLPPDDMLPLIREAFLEELAAPLEAIIEKRDTVFHQLVGDFIELDRKFPDMRSMRAVSPLEIRFFHRDEEKDE